MRQQLLGLKNRLIFQSAHGSRREKSPNITHIEKKNKSIWRMLKYTLVRSQKHAEKCFELFTVRGHNFKPFAPVVVGIG